MKKIVSLIVAVVVVAGIIYFAAQSVSKNPPKEITENRQYVSPLYGISFEYPTTYFLEEKDVDLTHRVHHTISLVEDTSPASEGPTSITVDIFQNDLDHQSAERFIKGNSASNYKLGDGKIATTTYGTLSGLEYAWSGLYEGRSFVIARDNFIYMFSVTRLTPSDKIIGDFTNMMGTVVIK